MSLSRRHLRMGLFAALLLSCSACGASGPRLYPVQGKVLFEDAPPVGATVVLHPVAGPVGALTPSGNVEADGGFRLRTHPHGEGAPPGEYAVVISWFPPNAREVENARNKLPARYADPKATPIPKVTIPEGPTTLEPFRLTKSSK